MRLSYPLFDPQGSPTPAAPSPDGQAAANPGAPAEQPAQPANPTPATPTIPDAPANPAPPAPTAESIRIQQLEQQIAGHNGSRELAGAAVSAGLKTPEDIARAQSAMQMVGQLEQAGYTPESIVSVLSGKAPATQEPQAPQPITQESIDQSVRNAMIGVQSEQQNASQWDSADSALGTKIDELTATNPAAKGFVESRLTQLAQGYVSKYPDGHPLAGKSSPPTVEQINQAALVVNGELAALLGNANATDPAVNPAAAVLNGGIPAAGGGGLQSATGGDGIAGSGQVQFHKLPKDQRNAVANQMLASAQAQNTGALGTLVPQGT